MTPDLPPAASNGAVALTPGMPCIRLLIQARRGRTDAVQVSLGDLAAGSGADLLPLGPGCWHLLLPADAPGDALAIIEQRLDGDAAVRDVTDGYGVLSLAGPSAAMVLAKLVRIDLSRIAPGHAARTDLHGMAVLVHRRAEAHYDLTVSQSYAVSLERAVEAAAASVRAAD